MKALFSAIAKVFLLGLAVIGFLAFIADYVLEQNNNKNGYISCEDENIG